MYSETKWSHRDETDEGEMNRESEVLMTEVRKPMEVLYKGKEQAKIKSNSWKNTVISKGDPIYLQPETGSAATMTAFIDVGTIRHSVYLVIF